MDHRGVKRGGCKVCGCEAYDGGSEGKKCEDCGHAPGKHKSLSTLISSSQAIQDSPTSPPSKTVHETSFSSLASLDMSDGQDFSSNSEDILPPEQKLCIYKGCRRKRYSEGTKVHEFCGKTHAQRHRREQAIALNPENQCKTPGCQNPRYEREEGGFFDYCSLYCRDHPKEEGHVIVAPTMREECALPGCSKPRYQDPANGRIHDFCSRTHAAMANKSDEIQITQLASGQEKAMVAKKFTDTWAQKKGQCPQIHCIFKVSNTKLTSSWNTYKSALPSSATEDYFHGTKLMCDILNTNTLCQDEECGVCGIANIGFDRRCIRKNINFQRFGHGFYLAPNSSKCHDYTQGHGGYRAMLLFEVCPGNKYQLQNDDKTLTAPPEGYNSVHGKAGGSLNYDELVLYNPDGAVLKYIIVYSKDGDCKIAV